MHQLPLNHCRGQAGWIRSWLLTVLISAVGLGGPTVAWASFMASAPPGTIEAGAPAYEVLGVEVLGLDSSPTDIREMPDGRILLVAGTQLALGDGVRWEVFRQKAGGPEVQVSGAMVDKNGSIYVGLTEGVARVEFSEDGSWRPVFQVAWADARQGSAQSMPEASVQVVGDEWIWHSLTGPLWSWRPRGEMRMLGYANTLEHVFRLGDGLYVGERAEGALCRIEQGKQIPLLTQGSFTAVTCSQPLDHGRVLVGTYGRGLRVFDGRSVRDFPADELFSNGWRCNDLCRIDDGFFAVALDNYGIVFLREDGRCVQVLDREVDNRLTRVKKLLAGRGGLLWGLWDGGIVRVQFPSNASHFESLFGRGLTTAHPFRLDGVLWLLADGRLYHGVYNQSNRLVRLEADGPSGLFVNAFSSVNGRPVVGTEAGAFVRTSRGWECFAPDAVAFRLVDPEPRNGRWLFVARNTVGWVEAAGESLRIVEPQEVPDLGIVFNKPVQDAAGRIWLELSIGRVGCVQLVHDVPTVRIFSEKDGLDQNWPQLFLNDGAIAAHLSDQIYRFDDAAGRFAPDPQYLARVPGVQKIFGRPGVDRQGRLWIAADGVLQVRERHGSAWDRVVQTVPLNYQPYFPTFEDDGTVWMHGLHRLTRIDPHMPTAPEPVVSAELTRLSVAGGKRQLYDFKGSPMNLDYADNSLVAHFVARGNTLGAAVNFEIRLEGVSTAGWVSVGSAGQASLDHLKEGDYVLHVRPRSGEVAGIEDTLAFTIRPPWFRTPWAYFTSGLVVLLAVGLAIWTSTVLERRENLRLEHVVTERTSEVQLSHAKLAKQMEEIRILTQAIAQSPVAIFITDPSGNIEYTSPRSSLLTGLSTEELVGRNLSRLRPQEPKGAEAGREIALALGRGESWTGQLALQHKDGHAVPVRSTVSPIFGQDGSIHRHLYLEDDISEWLDEQQRRRRIEGQLVQAQRIESVGRLAGGIAHDFNNILTGILGYCELAKLAAEENNDVRADLQQIRAAGLRAKDLVNQILAFSRKNSSGQFVIDLRRPVEEALKLIRATTPAMVEIAQELESGNVRADATQIHQVVVNLCTNAVHAIGERPGRVAVRLRRRLVDARLAAETNNLKTGAYMQLTVSDDGQGMDQKTLEHIFDPFFTTKPQGQGTGLGLSIVQGVVATHGGALQVQSEPGAGATFDLYFPIVNLPADQPAASAPTARGSGEEVLLVDDEPMVADFAKACLIHHGYRPSLFTDPQLALDSFRAAPGRYAAVVTDLTMPRLSGLDLLGAIRTQQPLMPAVILTGYGSEDARENISRLPRCLLLPKPFSGEDLAQTLNKVLTGKASPVTA